MHISLEYNIPVNTLVIEPVFLIVLLQGEQIFIELMQISNYIAMKIICKNFQILEGSILL